MGFETDYYPDSPASPSLPSRHHISYQRRVNGSETVETYSNYSGMNQRLRIREEAHFEPVEEKHASYAQIQTLMREYSEKHGVVIRQAPQVASGKKSSPRPPFFKEAAFLRSRVDNIQFPETKTLGEFLENASTLPILMKNETVCRGQQKYLIETAKQMHRIFKWMNDYGNEKNWLAQEFIESPGAAPCTFRVLVDCTGHIVTSQISYGPPHSMNKRRDNAKQEEVANDPAKLLELPSSEYFINSRSVISNHMLVNRADDTAIGGRITLNPLPISHPYSSVEKKILEAHGLDTESPMLPDEVARIASGIGRVLGMKGKRIEELVLSVDIIQREGTDDFYVLEVNRRPSMVAVRDMLGSANSVKEVDVWRWLINEAMQRTVRMHD